MGGIEAPNAADDEKPMIRTFQQPRENCRGNGGPGREIVASAAIEGFGLTGT